MCMWCVCVFIRIYLGLSHCVVYRLLSTQDNVAIRLSSLGMVAKADECRAVPGGYVLIWNNLGGVSAEAGYVTTPALPVPVPVPVPIPLVPPASSVVDMLFGHWWSHGYFSLVELSCLDSVSWKFRRSNTIGGLSVGMLTWVTGPRVPLRLAPVPTLAYGLR